MYDKIFHYEEIVSNDSTETNHSVRTLARVEDLSNRPVLRTSVFILEGGSLESMVHLSNEYESVEKAKEGHSETVQDVRTNPQKYTVDKFNKSFLEEAQDTMGRQEATQAKA